MFKRFFSKVNNAVLCGLSVFVFFVLGYIWWVYSADYKVSMSVLSLVIIICYVICIIVYGICSLNSTETIYRLPKIKTIVRENDKVTFIVERNDLFGQGAVVTICFQDGADNLEITLGLGYVESINSAGYMQIVFVKPMQTKSADDIRSNITNNSFYRNSIRIKPCIDMKFLREV